MDHFFANGSAQKVLSVQLQRKSRLKSSKFQNSITDWLTLYNTVTMVMVEKLNVNTWLGGSLLHMDLGIESHFLHQWDSSSGLQKFLAWIFEHTNALWVKANGEEALEISELCLSFYSHPNISDGNFILVPHFNCTQIFQIDLSRPKWTYFDFPFQFHCKM